MRLVICSRCHARSDVSALGADGDPLRCPCGAALQVPSEGSDRVAPVRRCGSCGAGVAAEAVRCAFCGSGLRREAHELSLLCPSCQARNAADARFCTACGRPLPPVPRELNPEESLPCPACEGRMVSQQVGGVPLQECPLCHGLWAPGESFAELAQRALEARRGERAPLAAATPRVSEGNPVAQPLRYRRCPVCGGHMQRRNFQRRSGIILDWCRGHGTWLDADELEAVAGYLARGGALAPGGPLGAAPGGAAAGSDAPREGSAREAWAELVAASPSSTGPQRGGELLPTLARVLGALLR